MPADPIPHAAPAFTNTNPERFGFGGAANRVFAPIQLATTTNVDITTAAPGTIISGVAIVSGQRILLAGQTNPAEIGVYDCDQSGIYEDSNTRPYTETPGLVIDVLLGNVGDQGQWQLTSVSPRTWTKVPNGAMPPQAGFVETAGVAISNLAPPFDNTPAAVVTNVAPVFDNTAPGAVSNVAPVFSDTAPQQKVVAGEMPPVAGGTSPNAPTAVNQSATLVAGTHYTVFVGTRAAPVTINLPDPGSLNQNIQIVDESGQGVAFPITVNAGTKNIETAGNPTYLINRNNAVLALTYTGTKWKIL